MTVSDGIMGDEGSVAKAPVVTYTLLLVNYKAGES